MIKYNIRVCSYDKLLVNVATCVISIYMCACMHACARCLCVCVWVGGGRYAGQE
jgi:hypothetical protein